MKTAADYASAEYRVYSAQMRTAEVVHASVVEFPEVAIVLHTTDFSCVP